jgi:hypothetical protein
METRCSVKARPGKSGGGLRLSLRNPRPIAAPPIADGRDDEARALKMSRNPLGGNSGHVLVSASRNHLPGGKCCCPLICVKQF